MSLFRHTDTQRVGRDEKGCLLLTKKKAAVNIDR